MSLLQGTLTHIERQATDAPATGASVVYLEAHATVAGRYVIGDSTAAAYLASSPIASALQRYLLDSSVNDRSIFLINSFQVFL